MEPVWPQTCDLLCQFSGFVRSEVVRNVAITLFSLAGLFLLFYRTKALLRQASAALAQAESAKAQANTAVSVAKVAERQAEIAWRGQLADRLIKTAPLLGGEEISERMGAVLALEEIARQSPDHHLAIIELLAAFVRESISIGLPKRKGAGKMLDSAQTDVALALDVIGRLNRINGRERPFINLGKCDFTKYVIQGNFQNTSFHGTILNDSLFMDCDLTDSIFADAIGSNITMKNARPYTEGDEIKKFNTSNNQPSVLNTNSMTASSASALLNWTTSMHPSSRKK